MRTKAELKEDLEKAKATPAPAVDAAHSEDIVAQHLDGDYEEFKRWKELKAKVREEQDILAASPAGRLQQEWQKDSVMVKGTYRHFAPQGGSCTFVYHKYKKDPIRTYTMRDGESTFLCNGQIVDKIPLGVALHLNTNTKEVEHSNVVGPDGRPTERVGYKKERLRFDIHEYCR